MVKLVHKVAVLLGFKAAQDPYLGGPRMVLMKGRRQSLSHDKPGEQLRPSRLLLHLAKLANFFVRKSK